MRRRRQLDAALGEYDVASQLNPALSTPHFEAAKVLSAKGDRAGGRRALPARGSSWSRESFYGYYTLGVVTSARGQWAEALATLHARRRAQRRDPRAHAISRAPPCGSANLDLAAHALRAMIELNIRCAPAQFNLGIIAARRGDPPKRAPIPARARGRSGVRAGAATRWRG